MVWPDPPGTPTVLALDCAPVCAISGRVAKCLVLGTPDASVGPEGIQIRLRVPMTLHAEGGWSKEITAFVDTGSEVSLVRRGVLPDDLLQMAERPMQLVTATRQVMCGGLRQAKATLELVGRCFEGGKRKRVAFKTPTSLLEADMAEDVLISYNWLANRHLDVHARDHDLMGHVSGLDVWVPGTSEDVCPQGSIQQVSVHALPVGSERRALDLFCGKKKCCQGIGAIRFQS